MKPPGEHGQRAEDPAWFVIRSRGNWHLSDPTGTLPAPVTSIGEVLARLDTSHPRKQYAPDLGHAPQGDHYVLREVWGWCGRIDGDRVIVEDPKGNPIALDAADLRLLDSVPDGTMLAELPKRCADPEAVQRAERLVRAGRLWVDQDSQASEIEQESASILVPIATTPRGRRPAPAALRVWRGMAETAAGFVERATFAYRRSSKVAAVRAFGGQSQGTSGPVVEPSPASRRVAPCVSPDNHSRGARVPVLAMWHDEIGPLLSLGMLTAAARSHGRLDTLYEVHRPEAATKVLERLLSGTGPAILLCSNYVWCLTENLEFARRAKEIRPDLLIIHGGPSTPKFEDDSRVFIDEHADVVDIMVRGEGETAICEILERLVTADGSVAISNALTEVDGLTFRDITDFRNIIRTPDRARQINLDTLPSPFLTGEFDHISPSAWRYCVWIETNRGCPYGCTFCDWGSATASRIRKFDLARVCAEIDWVAQRGINSIGICDANFGIMRRDVEIATHVGRRRQEFNNPVHVSFALAKNTTKHVISILEILRSSGVVFHSDLGIQTTDPTTLEVVNRSNIATDHFLTMAAEIRRHGLPVQCDLLLGLPGQTPESYKADLQFMLDHELIARTWPVQILPNAPMNDPAYRSVHGLRTNEHDIVVESTTFSARDRDHMLAVRRVNTIAEHMGLLRHLLRYLQWDLDLKALDVIDHLVSAVAGASSYPCIGWVLRNFEDHPMPAVGWHHFYEEFAAYARDELHVATDTDAYRSVEKVQIHLMPSPGRTFPDVLELEHDYLAYYRDATEVLRSTGRAGRPMRRLQEYPPGRLGVTGDPLDLCGSGAVFVGDSHDEVVQGDFYVLGHAAYELESPLFRTVSPGVLAAFSSSIVDDDTAGVVVAEVPIPTRRS